MKNYRDIRTDGGSGVLEQIVAQRGRVTDRLAAIRQILLVGSGKGGVGKSTVTAQLALALRRRGWNVGVLDADLNGPSIARMMGVRGQPFVPEGGALHVPRTCDGILVVSLGAMLPESESLEFPNVASSESFAWRSTKEFTTLTELLESIHWGDLDLLLVDLPPGPERTFQFAEYFGAEAPVLLVTQPSEVSRGVVSRAVAALKKVNNRLLGVVDNMDGYLCPQCSTVSPLFTTNFASELDIPRLGGLPFDPRLALLCDQGLSIESWSQLASTDAADRLVERLIKTLEEAR